MATILLDLSVLTFVASAVKEGEKAFVFLGTILSDQTSFSM